MAGTNEDHIARESQPREAAPSSTDTTLPAGGEVYQGEDHAKAKEFEHRETSGSSTTQPQPQPQPHPHPEPREAAPSSTETTLPARGEVYQGEDHEKAKEFEHRETSGSSTTQPQPESQSQRPPEEDVKKWGTHEMGAPAAPNIHPDNQQAAHWQAQGSLHQYHDNQQPYVMYSPVDKPADSPYDYVVNMFNSWSNRAEGISCNIWKHLKTGPSLSGTAWGKFNLTAKAITGGGFEPLFRQAFTTDPNEKLKRTFACYLSTTTGPVAGTIYLSTARVAFCSDRPLSFKAPSGQESWTYYKVSVPIGNVEGVNPVVTKQNPPEKYIQILTTDRHEFWYMGFVNFEKAVNHLFDAVSDSRTATGNMPHSVGHEPRN